MSCSVVPAASCGGSAMWAVLAANRFAQPWHGGVACALGGFGPGRPFCQPAATNPVAVAAVAVQPRGRSSEPWRHRSVAPVPVLLVQAEPSEAAAACQVNGQSAARNRTGGRADGEDRSWSTAWLGLTPPCC